MFMPRTVFVVCIVGLALTLVSDALLDHPAAAEPASSCDRPHIQAHLEKVEGELLAADVSHLSAAQRERRAHHIATLASYRERCEFPRQNLAPDRLVTVFVDDAGVHCAVGHLMALDGEKVAVARIRRDANTATIQELVDDPALVAWLDRSGLSAAEAARIQPGYCSMYHGGTCLCGVGGERAPTAIAEAEIGGPGPDGFLVEARVTRVHGTGVAVGDIRFVTPIDGDVPGRKVLITIYEDEAWDDEMSNYGRATGRGPQHVGDDQVSCTSVGMGGPGFCAVVPTDLYISALLSEDCMTKLGGYDPDLTRSVCDLNGGQCKADGLPPASQGADGCQGGAPGYTGWILAGLWVAICFGRRRRLV